MGRKAIGMMCAVFAAGMCFGGTINVAAGETLELDLRECQVTNVADSVITLGAGATLKLVESTPSSTAGSPSCLPTLGLWSDQPRRVPRSSRRSTPR